MDNETTHSNDLVLLLFFKDDLGEQTPGYPSAVVSPTIKAHSDCAQNPSPAAKLKDEYLYEAELFDKKDVGQSIAMMPVVEKIPQGCCVWGWWRKGWEHNDGLLKLFKDVCKAGGRPTVILYTQYLRMAYKAKLHDVYFVPEASTVEIPPTWANKCPDYYSDNEHLCGAFFVIEITEPEKWSDPTKLFSGYRVDELSFSILRSDFHSVISVPDGVSDFCADLIDNSPTRSTLRSCEHTIFALRIRSQKELTEQLLEAKSSDEQLADAFKCTAWGDIAGILQNLDIGGWRTLLDRPKTLKAIADVSDHNSVIRFDIQLVSWAISNESLQRTLMGEKYTNDCKRLRSRLIEWLLEGDVSRKRERAALFFSLVWDSVARRYGLADISEYFEKLPNLEEIAYSTQYGLRNKFYRDHLNHNIRAGLLAAYIASKVFTPDKGSTDKVLVAFLAGMLHDVAHPLASYEKIGQAIEKALRLLHLPIASRVQSLVEHEELLRQNLCVVTLLSSIRDLEGNQKRPLLPWKFRDEIIQMTDPTLLFEEMVCAMCDNHALLSAAVVFNTALNPKKGVIDNAKLREILQKGSGEGKEDTVAEFLNLIQAIALHDRKITPSLYGANGTEGGTPTALDFRGFPLATLTIIVDELQEWGRPIGDYKETLVNDCDIKMEENRITASYHVNMKHVAIGKTPYSFLEHLLAKVRRLSQMKFDANTEFSLEISTTVAGELRLEDCGMTDGRLAFDLDDKEREVWPPKEETHTPRDSKMTAETVFLAMSHPVMRNGIKQVSVSDFIVLNTKAIDDKPSAILNHLADNECTHSIQVAAHSIVIETSSYHIKGTIDRYYFTKLNRGETALKKDQKVAFGERAGILEVNVTEFGTKPRPVNIFKQAQGTRHLRPFPHFLDLDWRFSIEAVYAILGFVNEHAKRGRVCYLGCPSLALYHEQLSGMEVEYILIDKGHYGISQWCNEGLIDRDKIIFHDVYDALRESEKGAFDMVIMDSPWYEEYYEVFWYRALQLVKPEKIVGVAEYPGYKPAKLKTMKRQRRKIVRDASKGFFASVDISYSPPDFERAWGKDAEFTYTAINAYRPAYMDFYLIKEPHVDLGTLTPPHTDPLRQTIPLEGGHYVRCVDGLEELIKNGLKVSCRTRKSLSRNVHNINRIIAWSTKNTILTADPDKGDTVKSIEHLKNTVSTWEKHNTAN
jgi:hypothetical protein